MKNQPLVALVLIAMVFGVASAWIPPTFMKHTVKITNLLTGKQMLDVHCKSADDDLGLHHLYANQAYSFSFHVNWSASTLFFCHLWAGYQHVAFDAFKTEGDFYTEKCGGANCFWEAKDNGIYLINTEKKTHTFMYKWGKP